MVREQDVHKVNLNFNFFSLKFQPFKLSSSSKKNDGPSRLPKRPIYIKRSSKKDERDIAKLINQVPTLSISPHFLVFPCRAAAASSRSCSFKRMEIPSFEGGIFYGRKHLLPYASSFEELTCQHLFSLNFGSNQVEEPSGSEHIRVATSKHAIIKRP